jgi:hypothetical protein
MTFTPYLIIFIFEHFPIGSNVNLCPAVVAILDFRSALKNNFLKDLQMIIPGQFGFNCPSGLREEAFRNIFPIGSNVKLSPAVAAILNFISEQTT